MPKATDFIKWALTHAFFSAELDGADLPIPVSECCTNPWWYLFGTTKKHTTKAVIEERWKHYYSKNGWSRETYDYYTRNMKPEHYATDCGGLLDAYLTEQGIVTDETSRTYYNSAYPKGKIKDRQEFAIGTAVFIARKNGSMRHIGFICGKDKDGSTLVVEARGLAYGVCVTKLKERPWTHYGYLKQLYYGGETMKIFKLTKPMQKGEDVKALQHLLNVAGYKDIHNDILSEDGKLGKNTWYAFSKFLDKHINITDVPEDVLKSLKWKRNW